MDRTPVVFIHGAWLHVLSWELWAERFAHRGYRPLAPGWPGEAATAHAARKSPGALAGLGLEALTDHYAGIVRSLDVAPVLVGHSVGGLVAQHLLGHNLGRAAVAIAAAPINDVPLPEDPRRRWTPDQYTAADPLVPLSAAQFHQSLANTEEETEAYRLFERYALPAPRRLLTDLGCGAAARSPRAAADVDNAGRGPLLLISGQEDRMVPDAVTRAVYKEYGDSTAVTDLKQFADRAHSLVFDSGWRPVADHVLGWLDERGIRARAANA
ncbi:alpha/beta hydrolase [Streptomyces sp. TLI_105]|uniref:alpha/beta hydrolase n=1 Tax=Streptomyces sp. TLI_105 TaxID=1881019 RepID=UPI00089C2D9D|nr:alpha/beta hydrolase [Streptomyces sp. TLI_105]SEE58695.1 Lysophospholipase, alpha-beta hydrolase superfamily [Streptomyces sp. TLI_105]